MMKYTYQRPNGEKVEVLAEILYSCVGVKVVMFKDPYTGKLVERIINESNN